MLKFLTFVRNDIFAYYDTLSARDKFGFPDPCL
jgi:hypothetical protein